MHIGELVLKSLYRSQGERCLAEARPSIGGFVTELVYFAPCNPVFQSILIFSKPTLHPMIAVFSPSQAMLRL
jgi:hypothetical protein